MPQASSPLPKLITFVWGTDRLEIEDPIWIENIVHEMEQNAHLEEDNGLRLFVPHSRRCDAIEAHMQAIFNPSRVVVPKAPIKPKGYQEPEQQWPVAIDALRVFLGVELPVALNFTSWSGRSDHRMTVVQTSFSRCRSYRMFDELRLCWVFNGYQLYATHHIGQARYRPLATDTMGHIERRLLNGQWVRWGYDGASTPPTGRQWSSNRRTFIIGANGIQRLDADDSDLEPLYDDEEEDDVEDGLPQSQADL